MYRAGSGHGHGCRFFSLDGLLYFGFLAQVGAELFVVAGWWALCTWSAVPGVGRMALVGLMGAAVFLVWPIWIGPLMVAVVATVALQHALGWRARAGYASVAIIPVAAVAALHLSQHAA